MPISYASMVRNTATFTMSYGGESAAVTYRPSAINTRFSKNIKGLTLEEVAATVLTLLVAWELEITVEQLRAFADAGMTFEPATAALLDGDRADAETVMFPLEIEPMCLLGLDFLSQLFYAIMADYAVDPTKKEVSGAP